MEVRVLLPRMSSIHFTCENLAARRPPKPVLYFPASKEMFGYEDVSTHTVRLPSIEHELRRYPMNALSLVPAPYATLLPCKPSAIAASFSASIPALPSLLPFTAIFSV